MAKHNPNVIYKVADDTAAVSWVMGGDELVYSNRVCCNNNLNKTKELVVEFRKAKSGDHVPVLNGGIVLAA